jgi:hypothetical protein
MRPRKLLQRLLDGQLNNVRFHDLDRLVQICGFERDRTVGSHHIYLHRHVPVSLNLQDLRGHAKPYQIRQFLRLVDRYDLIPEELR